MQEGKIIKSLSGFYFVKTEESIVQCRGRGVFRKKQITPLVGDHVEFIAENNDEGYILDIKDRKNKLIRPPVANIDQVFLIFSAKDPEFNTLLLDRFLVYIESKNIKPVIVITKQDLIDGERKKAMEGYVSDYGEIGYEVVVTSAKENEGVELLFPLLEGKVSVFAGQSGVGKSTLLNVLEPNLNLETNVISKYLGRGKHTTRHVELLEIGNGLVADTPGFSSIDFDDIEAGELSLCFPEMREREPNCKFRGCLHIKEPNCAVKTAVETGDILPSRYKHYSIFLHEIQERKPRY